MKLSALFVSAMVIFSDIALGAVMPEHRIRSTQTYNGKNGYLTRHGCLSDSQAALVVSTFSSLLTSFNAALANATLASDFTDQSDSIDFLTGAAPGTLTFPSKAAFINSNGGGAPIPSITTLNVWHTCDQITWRWRANLTPLPVQGIDSLVVSKGNFLIETVYSEFNSGAWAQDAQ